MMRPVSKEEFFKAMGPLNVHPKPERDVTHWELPNRRRVGRSEPGWNPDGKPARYFLPDGEGDPA